MTRAPGEGSGNTPAVSLVLVCYQMQRELPRTLLSLAPGYQQADRDGGRVEVIVVDNGSRPPPDPAAFGDLGLDLAIHRWPDPTVSPVAAANFGLGLARAPLIGLWIDGARLASPGLVSACLRAARLHPRPVVATYNYHLGHRLQYFNDADSYGPEIEDALLASIGWPRDGTRLFEIATLDNKGGLTGPMIESNALFMPRALWDELGGLDPRFTSPGGGAANPDLFVRACALPEVQLIRVLGEGTFHQTHGGTSTGAAAGLMEAGKAMSREYFRLRGRPVSAVKSLGWLFDAATGSLAR